MNKALENVLTFAVLGFMGLRLVTGVRRSLGYRARMVAMPRMAPWRSTTRRAMSSASCSMATAV